MMDDLLHRWLANNETHLALSLAWLRACLLDPTGEETVVARRSAELAAAADPPPALALLARRLGLSAFEQDVLLFCAAPSLDPNFGLLLAEQFGHQLPTFGLAFRLFDEPAWDVLSLDRPLRAWQLFDVALTAEPITSRPLLADDRLVHYLKGLNTLDERLVPLLTALPPISAEDDLPPSQASVCEAIWSTIQDGDHQNPTLQLVGDDQGGLALIARHVAARFGRALYRLLLDYLPTQPAELDRFVRLWTRETLLAPVALFVDAVEPDGEISHGLRRLQQANNGLLIIGGRTLRGDVDGPVFDVARPTAAEQSTAWRAALNGQGPALAGRLAGQFNLNLPDIRRLAAAAPNGHHSERQLWQHCLMRTRPRLDRLAQRIDARATWSDIVLPAHEQAILRQMAAQARHRIRVYDDWGFRQRLNRGLGISALFAGPSGTGKTMAAEVLANDLDLNLYRIDLSAVVNKYIGETEKNLRRLFDAAEDGGAILFFDEADALFGKRSEVKDSHDRYANIEINYLLQRMEAYGGLAILATNMRGALDQAFMRRLRFVVNFAFPSRSERETIWRIVFPADVPLADLDYPYLARLQLTGASINNIAINAAFAAADAGSEVTMDIILAAGRGEYHKMGRPVNESDFHWEPAAKAPAEIS
jgi:hypothetical protein